MASGKIVIIDMQDKEYKFELSVSYPKDIVWIDKDHIGIVAVTGLGLTIRIWDVQQKNYFLSPFHPSSDDSFDIFLCKCSPDGTKLVNVTDEKIEIINLKNGDSLNERANDNVYFIKWAPDGKTFAEITFKKIRIINAENGRSLHEYDVDDQTLIKEVNWSGDGTKFMTQSSDKFEVWNLEKDCLLYEIEYEGLGDFAFSSDGNHYAAGPDVETYLSFHHLTIEQLIFALLVFGESEKDVFCYPLFKNIYKTLPEVVRNKLCIKSNK